MTYTDHPAHAKGCATYFDQPCNCGSPEMPSTTSGRTLAAWLRAPSPVDPETGTALKALPNGCTCGHLTLAGAEYARYVDPADMGERVLPESFALRTVHDAVRAIEAEAASPATGEGPEYTRLAATTPDTEEKS